MTRRPRIALALTAALAVGTLIGPAGAAGAGGAIGAVGAAPTVAATTELLEPGPYHRLLDPLAGTWQATKTNWALGRNGEPVVSRDIIVKTRWLDRTGGRFLEETTRGTLAGRPYYSLGILGFSNVDKRYEWTTFNSVTPQAMTYRGEAVTGRPSALSIPGEFTDPGILGPEFVGKTIRMRTVITIGAGGRPPVFELYFTPPGQPERLIDRTVYTRRIG
ncbi:DUF1579 family protein [Streptomyces sp. NK15101]|uniref:DUF1579 family protein n=1 Tax=Streptomyces sp. NK15101 TaxID=2873261 RepID=UPI001CECC34C|nr:DUF1579 family protein [Streptomyces sp. NK15101]